MCMFVYDTQKYFSRHYFELLTVVISIMAT